MRVAVVDDSPMVRAMLGQHLRAFGHDPFEIAPTAVFDVLRSLREFEIGLAIVDLQMPACPGLSLIRAIREDLQLVHLPGLVHTAHLEDDAASCLQQMKVNGVAPKPMNPKDLEGAGRRALQGAPWAPAFQRSRIALVDEIDARRHHLHDRLHQAGHLTQELDLGSCFELMDALLKAPPVLLVVSLGWDACSVPSLIRLIREDPRLRRLPILAFGRPTHEMPEGFLAPFDAKETEGTHTPGRLLEAILGFLEATGASADPV